MDVMAIEYKIGVNYRGLHPKMRKALLVAERVYQSHGRTLVVTAGLDGDHKKLSWHYFGSAVDLRTNYFTPAELKLVASELQSELGMPYEVVVEATHIHLEYDWDKERA